MSVLIAYASRHGATRGIAERIGSTLERAGLTVSVTPVADVADIDDVGGHDAVVVGSAAYLGSWLSEATSFVRRNRVVLASRPVWLFSSGPVGSEKVDAKGRDVLTASRPKEFDEFAASIHPRDERVFFGAYDPDAEPIGMVERIGAWITPWMPEIRELLPAGDFRDWAAIEAWAEDIARELRSTEPLGADGSDLIATGGPLTHGPRPV